jgi:2-aminoadipate transaminase
MTGPAPLVARFEIAKQALDLCTGALDQRVVCQALVSGLVKSQVPRLRSLYESRRDAMAAALARELGGRVTWPAAKGGFFLWVTLPDGVDAERLLPVAREHGVLYVVGRAFLVDGSGPGLVRLSYSAHPGSRIDEGVRRLARAVREVEREPQFVDRAGGSS